MNFIPKLVLFCPLFGFLLSGLFSKFLNKKLSDNFSIIVTTAFVSISFISSLILFLQFISGDIKYAQDIILLNWINSGTFTLDWAIKLDQLSVIMFFVVTLVSTLVHIYSIGYMHEDNSKARFMSYLSLFTFFMLALVSSNNFVQLFFGWEGVGVASYLLIGFWFKKESANNASMKAFIANRVGDFGLIIAIAMIYLYFGSVEFANIFPYVANFTVNHDLFNLFGAKVNVIDAISILLFVGAMGKSAQIFLHVWLADAMEGPTPVSALIHAATMVTAGVFLLARCSYIFEYSSLALSIVVFIGALTAIFAATIAITQNDIKKIIAYSTCSQLGYMFFASGLSFYSAGMFHLVTHAFFKALLFLGAGSVIHAMHHEQDIRNMGGLYKKIPFTYVVMWIGTIAICGLPPFSGYFSKDFIIEASFISHSKFAGFAFISAILAAFLTSLYSFRLMFLVFHGDANDKKAVEHAHESPYSMLFPLLILAIGSILAGLLLYKFLHITSIEGFFKDVIFNIQITKEIEEKIHHVPFYIKFLPLALTIFALIISYILFVLDKDLPSKIAKKLSIFYKISHNKYYFDEIYEFLFVKPSKKIGLYFWQIIDIKVIDNFVNFFPRSFAYISTRTSKIQSGYIYHYLFVAILGVVSILGILIFFFLKY